MPEPTKPTPSDRLPNYIAEGLQKQDSETLRAITVYAQDLRVYRAARAGADQSAADSHYTKQAVTEKLAAKAQSKGIQDDDIDWGAIAEKGVSAKASIVTKTINENRYYYFQWREGDRIKSEYIAPMRPK